MNSVRIQLLLIMLILGFLAGPRALSAIQRLVPEKPTPPVVAQVFRPNNTPDPIPQHVAKSPYEKLNLKAKSVFVWDIKYHRKLYGYNEYQALPLASLTKMMLALVAVETLPSNAKVTIRAIDLLEEGDNGLFPGEQWKLADLIKFTLLSSSNDGASAIAAVAGATLGRGMSTTSDPHANKRAFIEKMNEKARAIGLINTRFRNETGLDIESFESGASGSARDMGLLFEYILKRHPELLAPTTRPELHLVSDSAIMHHVANTNPGIERMNGIIGSKTGYTDLAGGNLVVVVDIGIARPVVIAVLGSTRSDRFTDVEQLVNATIEAITSGGTGATNP